MLKIRIYFYKRLNPEVHLDYSWTIFSHSELEKSMFWVGGRVAHDTFHYIEIPYPKFWTIGPRSGTCDVTVTALVRILSLTIYILTFEELSKDCESEKGIIDEGNAIKALTDFV